MFTATDKTLVSWFCFDEETPKHCSVVTVQAAEKYDALSFGQDAPGKWSTAMEKIRYYPLSVSIENIIPKPKHDVNYQHNVNTT